MIKENKFSKDDVSKYLFGTLTPDINLGMLEINIWHHYIRNKYANTCDTFFCGRNRLLHPCISWSLNNKSSIDPNFPHQSDLQVEHYLETSPHYVVDSVKTISDEMSMQAEPFFYINYCYSDVYIKHVGEALKRICALDPSLKWLFENFIREIIVCESSALIGCSIQMCPGIIFIAPRKDWSIYMYIDTLIHELSHQELYIRQLVDPIVLENYLVHSPIRGQSRPTIALIHASFVMFRVIFYLKKIQRMNENSIELDFLVSKNVSLFKDSLKIMEAAKGLTNVGKIFVDNLLNMNEINFN